jgi:hypothetical protein
MATTYADVVTQVQEQTVKAIESGFDLAAKMLELQKQYALRIAEAATPPRAKG